MKIGQLKNYEVCDVDGNESIADIFIVENNGDITVHVFESNEISPHPAEFSSTEQQQWLEDVAFFFPLDPFHFNGNSRIIWEVIADLIREINSGSLTLPQLPYAGNDETQTPSREQLETDYFRALFFHDLNERQTN